MPDNIDKYVKQLKLSSVLICASLAVSLTIANNYRVMLDAKPEVENLTLELALLTKTPGAHAEIRADSDEKIKLTLNDSVVPARFFQESSARASSLGLKDGSALHGNMALTSDLGDQRFSVRTATKKDLDPLRPDRPGYDHLQAALTLLNDLDGAIAMQIVPHKAKADVLLRSRSITLDYDKSLSGVPVADLYASTDSNGENRDRRERPCYFSSGPISGVIGNEEQSKGDGLVFWSGGNELTAGLLEQKLRNKALDLGLAVSLPEQTLHVLDQKLEQGSAHVPVLDVDVDVRIAGVGLLALLVIEGFSIYAAAAQIARGLREGASNSEAFLLTDASPYRVGVDSSINSLIRAANGIFLITILWFAPALSGAGLSVAHLKQGTLLDSMSPILWPVLALSGLAALLGARQFVLIWGLSVGRGRAGGATQVEP